jgi:signal transduction histidine kinase
MPVIAPPPELGAFLRRYRIELLWVVFALANSVVMFVAPGLHSLPFYFVWISLTLLYGFRLWPLPATLLVLACVIAVTAAPMVAEAVNGTRAWDSLLPVPLIAMMFLAMVWHAQRRVDALRVAQDRAEARESLLARHERFIHDASHELRTPVTIATGHLELAQADGAAAGGIDIALDELARMNAIIERLLVLAAADQPDFLRLEEIDLETFLEDVFMRWSEVAPRAWRLGPLVPVRLTADRDRLRAALDALLENAVKYTSECDAIELRARTDAAARTVIEVEDEGCGIADQARERIFDRFARADAARTRSAGGVGLGLAIVDAIAKRHGGRCRVQSTADGTIFSLVLPATLSRRSADGWRQPVAGAPER